VTARGATPFRLEGNAPPVMRRGEPASLSQADPERSRRGPAPDNGGVPARASFAFASGFCPRLRSGFRPSMRSLFAERQGRGSTRRPGGDSPCGSEVHSPPALVRVFTCSPARWPPLRWVLVLVEACAYSIDEQITPFPHGESRGGLRPARIPPFLSRSPGGGRSESASDAQESVRAVRGTVMGGLPMAGQLRPDPAQLRT